MKGQYLSFDAIIAAVIFMITIISAFNFLQFSLFSEQSKINSINSHLITASNLMLSRTTSTCSLVDISRAGKIMDIRTSNFYNNVRDSVRCLNESTPYFVKMVVLCEELPQVEYPPTPQDPDNDPVEYVVRARRGATGVLNDQTKPCSIDLYLGVDK